MRDFPVGEPLIAGFAEVDLDLVFFKSSDARFNNGFIGVALRAGGLFFVEILEHCYEGLFLGHEGLEEVLLFKLSHGFGMQFSCDISRIPYTDHLTHLEMK
jgi:hypothetical protein